MLGRILRRVVHSVIVLFGLSILIFFIARVIPGDPARISLGSFATEEQVQKLREEMHLDKPLYVQYYYWLTGALRGDFGKSLYTDREITQDIKDFLPATLELMFFAFLMGVIIGQTLGIISARYSNTWIDHVARLISYAGVVTPPYVFAIIFLLFFGYIFNLLPTVGRLSFGITPPPVITGMITVDGLITGHFTAVLDALKHLILPAISLAMAALSQEARITRSSILDNSNKDYIAMERSQSIPERVINLKYLLKPSLIPTVSVMGLDFAVMLSNAFLVELIFNWGGFSQYGINAMLHKDLNAIIVVVMVLGLMFVSANIVVDIIISYLDPRIRLGVE